MSDPIEGKGKEMLPDKGNPFSEPAPAEIKTTADQISDWENERAADLASGTEGRSSRAARVVESPAITANPETAKANVIETPLDLPGVIKGFLPGQEISAASLASNESDESADFHESITYTPESNQHEKINDLMERAEDAHWKITDSIDNFKIARDMLSEIQLAKTLLDGSGPNTGEAERKIAEVEFRINLANKTALWSSREGKKVLWYEIIWFGLIIAMFFVLPFLRLVPEASKVVTSALAGGLGGVFAALYALWQHISEKQDYNPKHNIWYFIQPIMGLPIGGLIYLLFFSIIQFSTGSNAPVNNGVIIYIISAFAGSQQNTLNLFARKITDLFKP